MVKKGKIKSSPEKKENKEIKQKLIEVVDSNVQTAVSISHILRNLGYRTIEAYGAESAVKTAVAENPDLILLDTTLDNASGEDVAKRLAGAKIIFMGIDGDYTKGIVGRIKKPIDNEELEKAVKKVLK